MSHFPLVSIIVNNFNYGRFLREAIDSALAQTYSRVEVLVVDDGSTDESRDIITSYGKSIMPILKENGGQASTFNSGFSMSAGDVVLFLDADDKLMPTALETITSPISEPGSVKAHWPLVEIDEEGRQTGRIRPQWLPQGDLSARAISEGPSTFVTPPTTANAWTRRFLESVLPVPEEEYRISADYYLSQMSTVLGVTRRISSPQGYVRTHGSNAFRALPLDRMVENNLRLYEGMLIRLSDHLKSRGIDVNQETWKSRSAPYKRWLRLQASFKALQRLIQPGEAFVLIDDGQWEIIDGNEILSDRKCLRLPLYCASATGVKSDGSVLQELAQLLCGDASYVVLASSAASMIKQSQLLHEYLISTCHRILNSDDLVVFRIGSNAKQGAVEGHEYRFALGEGTMTAANNFPHPATPRDKIDEEDGAQIQGVQSLIRVASRSEDVQPKERANGDLSAGTHESHTAEVRPANNETIEYWSQRYDFMYYKYVEYYVRVIGAKATSLIDVGSAGGNYVKWFPWIKSITSLDFRNPFIDDGIVSIKADFLKWEPTQSYDLALCLQVLEHVRNPEEFMQKLFFIARHVIVSVPYNWPEGTQGHVQDPVDFEKLIKWARREPNYHQVVAEPFQDIFTKKAHRLIAYFDVQNPKRTITPKEFGSRRTPAATGFGISQVGLHGRSA